MNREEFKNLIKSKIILLDGATGTNLQKSGMPTNICPEQWILENKDIVKKLQQDYVKAGTNILYAPTFTANKIKLEEYGLQDKIEEINTEIVKLSREAAGDKAYIAGDLTMTGEQLYPTGKLQFEELVEIYKEQIKYILKAGVDLFVVETMMSLQETRAAVLAIKESCELPIMATLTFNEGGKTLYGTDPKTALIVLQSLGVDAVGINCSTGPDKMLPWIEEMKEYATVPLIVKPNAGLPKLIGDQTVFDMNEETFAKEVKKLVEAGVSIVGGCCGTTPAYIERLAEELKGMSVPKISSIPKSVVTTDRKSVDIDINKRFMIIGERINPTGKKAFQAELREGKLDMLSNMTTEQVEGNADILDVNVGMNGIDEKEMMLKVIYKVLQITDTPLAIDSSNSDVIEAALRIYPGRALINSISLETQKIERLLPLAKKYGAMFILLPLSDKGLPENLEEKKEIIHTILEKAYAIGLKKEDVIIDGLVTTVGANKMAAVETLETIRHCKEDLGIATSIGLSNISFGLPQRPYINSTFLSFAIKDGLTMAIANPSGDLLINAALASDLLLAKDGADIRYINNVKVRVDNPVNLNSNVEINRQKADSKLNTSNELNTDNKVNNHVNETTQKVINPVFNDVLKGNTDTILKQVKEALKENTPTDIIDNMLIPAINEVGKLFDEMKYFLPQLINSANTMKIAIEYLEPMIDRKTEGKEQITIVIATVEGDIHDIGKNLVALMLRNYGYNIIDLGKDVPAQKIIETAKETNAQIIALSALMTTTMKQMEKVIKLAKEENLKAKIIIGGAVITQNYADEIVADGYSKDAADAVQLVKRLLRVKAD